MTFMVMVYSSGDLYLHHYLIDMPNPIKFVNWVAIMPITVEKHCGVCIRANQATISGPGE